MHDLATVSVIQKIESIEGRDRIELATVENYSSIVQKGQFREGEKVVYIYYDAILPVREEFEFLRKRCWSPKYNGFRIKPMKMGGVVSEGLVMPLSILKDGDSLPLGTVVTDMLSIRRYAPEEENVKYVPQVKVPSWAKLPVLSLVYRKFFSKSSRGMDYPVTVPKADEENIEKCWDKVASMNDEFIVTEKMEGTAVMYMLDRKKRLHVFSHNREAGFTGVWGAVADEYRIETGLRKLRSVLRIDIAIEGEICAPGIQKNIYGFSEPRFFLYAAYDIRTGRRLSWSELERLAAMLVLETVPFIKKSRILPSLDAMLADCEGKSVFSQVKNPPREGLVWRTEDGRVHFKCKSHPYKVWFISGENE